jgi:3',5'-cyclic AMP phosphodiesterase CpdA
MKIALITDTHWGVRNDSIAFHNNNKKFLDNVFFPKLASLGIDHVIHLGDIVDRRKYINFLTANRLRNDFLDPLESMGITLDSIAGNHDG